MATVEGRWLLQYLEFNYLPYIVSVLPAQTRLHSAANTNTFSSSVPIGIVL